MPKYVRVDGISPGFRLDQILASGDSTDSPIHTLLVKCQIGSRAHEDGGCTPNLMAKSPAFSPLFPENLSRECFYSESVREGTFNVIDLVQVVLFACVVWEWSFIPRPSAHAMSVLAGRLEVVSNSR